MSTNIDNKEEKTRGKKVLNILSYSGVVYIILKFTGLLGYIINL